VSLHLGAAAVDRVEEQQFPVPFTLLSDDEDFVARRIAPLPGGFLDPATGTFLFSNHSWVLRVDGLIVLIDPCNGNGRTRAVATFDHLQLPFLERLSATGTGADAIDVVFCTHLHNDHCGWNTRQVDGRWVPTFANAEYVFVEAEYRRWDTSGPDHHPNDFNESVFDECVGPVVDAGLARIVSVPHAISPSLTIELAPGHTMGHSILRLESDGVRAYFTGDCFHHPAQVSRPECHLPGCDDLELAIDTRRTLLGRIHGEGAFLFPAHFSDPHYGSLDVDGDELVFRPGGAPGALTSDLAVVASNREETT
jgi:glyoxylase-like metal-dependent hydrolase (beta-lactamase superfamily II)